MDPTNSRNFRYFKGVKHKQNNSKPSTNKKSNKTKTRTRSLKKQIHDTQRLLFKNILCEEGIRGQQEKLAKLKKSYFESRRVNIDNKKFARYKGVKFFDKSKVLKKLTSLNKLITATDSDKNEAKNILEQESILYRRYLNYTAYFPVDSKYISLFPTSERLDPGAQEQVDTLLQEIDSRVKQGLYADAWTAHLAKTPVSPVPISVDIIAENKEELLVTSTSLPSTSPLFIPIDTSDQTFGKKSKPTGSTKKRFSKKLQLGTDIGTQLLDSPIKFPSTDDSKMCHVECGEDLKSDSFFFFDTKGSKLDANLFKNRPQKRNFQETPRNPRPNLRNPRPKQKHRSQS